jgi:hypothetical protein
MKNQIVILLILAGILVIATVTIALANSGKASFPPLPPAKQTVVAIETEDLETRAAGPTGIMMDQPVLPFPTEPASCPRPTPDQLGIVDPKSMRMPFFASEVNINSEAVVISGGVYYYIWFGAPGDYPHQGLIRVLVYSADPCASHRLGTTTPSSMTDYRAPKGPLTVTKVEGAILVYSIAGGGIGRFNVATGQFLP